MSSKWNATWPVLKEYSPEHLSKIALPLGGIGTGTVSLTGRGALHDWEIMNKPAKGYNPKSDRNCWPSFILRTSQKDSPPTARLLEGPLYPFEYEGDDGSKVPSHGLPRFNDCSFATAYPLAQVALSDKQVPVSVRLEAFNPLTPANLEASSHPVAFLRYVLTNNSTEDVSASICASLPNFIGHDGSGGRVDKNRNIYREVNGLRGIFFDSEGVDKKSEQWGTMALVSPTPGEASYRTAWLDAGWGTSLLDFWDDYLEDGVLDEREVGKRDNPTGSLVISADILPGETRELTFIVAWHFPNRQSWTLCSDDGCDCTDSNTIGNWYTERSRDAWDAAEIFTKLAPELEKNTVEFVKSICDSEPPTVVKEAALFNLSTLRSQTTFRTPDGRFYGFEGCNDNSGCCLGSCTHVWNYEQATAFLFGELALTMRDVEFAYATDENGLMSFRVHLPLTQCGKNNAQSSHHAAADGQMGCVMKLYRDWQLSGDETMLARLWPAAKRALSFAWLPGGWDADKDGVMEGPQHNTMDVEYYGPNPQMGSWYLGALRAAEEMARHLGEIEFADECHALFKKGSAWLDENLFNGEYYVHEIRPYVPEHEISKSLILGMDMTDKETPEYQLGEGCLVDQLVGQTLAHVMGLGYLLEPKNIATTLKSILKYNKQKSFQGHFNCMRSYALGDESALLMAAYPHTRPENPFPYFTEVMTGFEYTAALGMLQEGQVEAGLNCIRDIRARYDGQKRNPFDEAECGHHYSRAMISWAAFTTLTGFRYSAVSRRMEFGKTARPTTNFWSTGYAWGTISQAQAENEQTTNIKLKVLGGSLRLEEFKLGERTTSLEKDVLHKQGDTLNFEV